MDEVSEVLTSATKERRSHKERQGCTRLLEAHKVTLALLQEAQHASSHVRTAAMDARQSCSGGDGECG